MRHPQAGRGFLLPLLVAIVFLSAASVRAEGHEASGSGNPLALQFEANQGQVDESVRFLARGTGYALYLTPAEAVLELRSATAQAPADRGRLRSAKARPVPGTRSVLRMRLAGANASPELTGLDEQRARSHYLIGADPKRWHTDVAHYGRVRYAGVYPGIDLVYYGRGHQLEYDFVVDPGADPGVIRMSFAGARELRLEESGDLVLRVGDGDVRLAKPVVYQQGTKGREPVAGHYALRGNEVGFELAAYDTARPLVIDPVLLYSTYLGGAGFDEGLAIAVDMAGSAYVLGDTLSLDYPSQDSAVQPELRGGEDLFVAKLNPAGTELLYSTYLGGSGTDFGFDLVVDMMGRAAVVGFTSSSDFPTTWQARQKELAGGEDAFVLRLDPQGSSLVYSTYFGGRGTDDAEAIALGALGSLYVAGRTDSVDFPTTSRAYKRSLAGTDGAYDAFVVCLDGASRLVYSTYLGGSDFEDGGAIAVDMMGAAYVAGTTVSRDFPVTAGAMQREHGGGGEDGFVAKLDRQGASLVYSTYMGGYSDDGMGGIAVDLMGQLYASGYTFSAGGFPVTDGVFQTQAPNPDAYSADGFVLKLNAAGSGVVYSTLLGGSGEEFPRDLAVDLMGQAYVTGRVDSTTIPDALPFPTTADAVQRSPAGGFSEAFVAKVSRTGARLLYSTLLGGSEFEVGASIAVNPLGDIFVTGQTTSVDFPTTAGALQPDAPASQDLFPADAFIVRIRPARNASGAR